MKNRDIFALIKNSAYLYLVQGLNFLLPLFVLPYLISTLSVSSFGIYSFAFAFSQFAILVIDFGFNITATKKIVEHSHDPIKLKEIFWTVILIKFIFFVAVFLLGNLLCWAIPPFYAYRHAVFWALVTAIGTVFFPIWWFQGLDKFREMGVISVVGRFLTYPLVFVFVDGQDDYLPAVIIPSAAYVVSSIFAFGYIFRSHRDYFSNLKLVGVRARCKEQIADAWPIFLSNSSISMYTHSMVIVLGAVASSYSVGIFGALDRIVRVVCSGLLVPLNQACFPYLVKLKGSDLAGAKEVFRKILYFVLGIGVLVYLAYFPFQGWIEEYFFKGYERGAHLLSIFLLCIFPISVGGVFGQLGLLAIGGPPEKRIFSNIYGAVGLGSLPLSFLLIYFLHEYGAIASVMVIESIICIGMGYFVFRRGILSVHKLV